MKLKPIASNMTELTVGDYSILFSYQTPVAAIHISGEAFKTSKNWSKTTNRHITKYFGVKGETCDFSELAKEQPQEFFDSLIASVK